MPGPAGEVDKSEIRSMASKVAQYWPDRSQRSRRLAPAARISTITHRKAQPTNGYLIEALALSSYWRSRTSSTGRTRWSGSSSEAASEGMHAAPHLALVATVRGPGLRPFSDVEAVPVLAPCDRQHGSATHPSVTHCDHLVKGW